MTDPELKFPIELYFQKGRARIAFATMAEIEDWKASEIGRWQSVTRFKLNQVNSPNLESIEQLKVLPDLRETVGQLTSMSATYFPLTIGMGSGLWNLTKNDPVTMYFAVSYLLDSSSVSLNLNDARHVQALTYATVLNAVGNPLEVIEHASQAQSDMEVMRAREETLQDNFNQIIGKAKADWASLIEGYETRAALQAPRDYWSKRADKHTAEAAKARIVWNRVMTVVVAITAAAFAALIFTPSDIGNTTNTVPASKGESVAAPAKTSVAAISPQAPVKSPDAKESGPISAPTVSALEDLVTLLKRLTLVGTLLAFVVWWMRQTLRDLRSHEHLAEDAAERVTMIETYAALKGHGLETGDIAPVLAALYRPAATGMIEDGGPVLPIEVLMKTVTGAVGKPG